MKSTEDRRHPWRTPTVVLKIHVSVKENQSINFVVYARLGGRLQSLWLLNKIKYIIDKKQLPLASDVRF